MAFIDGVAITPTAVCSGGTYSITPDTPLAQGNYSVTVTSTDPSGNVSEVSPATAVEVDTTAPDAPTVTSPTNGAPVIGTAEAGSEVVVTTPSGATCTTTADVNGDYSCTLAPDPVDGEDLTVTATDTAGNTSTPTTVVGAIDTSAPNTLAAPNVDGAPVTNNASPAITGSCTDGDVVTAYIDGAAITPTAACSGGTYSITPDTPLADGDYDVTVTAADNSGNVSDISPTTSVTVDTAAPSVPTLSVPETSNDSTPTVTGTAEPGSTVNIKDSGDNIIGTGTADINGDYSIEITTPLTDGDHTLTANSVDAAGNTSVDSAPDTVTIDTTAPTAPTISAPTLTNDNTPTVTGTAESR